MLRPGCAGNLSMAPGGFTFRAVLRPPVFYVRHRGLTLLSSAAIEKLL